MAKETTNTTPVADASTVTKARVRRKVPAGTVKRLASSASKAIETAKTKDKAAEKAVIPAIEKRAIEGIEALRTLVKKGTPVEGLSPMGHKVACQNGQLDVAILNAKGYDFQGWLTNVCKANCASRRSEVTDNETFVKRLQSHLKSLSGRKASAKVTMPKRLDKVGLKSEVKSVFQAMTPVSELFDEYVANGQF